MIELVATIIITASSALLFGYWFRYTCLLILSAKTTKDYAADFAAANQLKFREVQSQLQNESFDLDSLHASLDRDYAVVTYLMGHVSGNSESTSSLEVRMLEINYRLMGAWFSVTKHFSASAAQGALEEMATVVAHFANMMGERAAMSSATMSGPTMSGAAA